MRTCKYLFVIMLAWLCGSAADGEFLLPTYAPVERLIANTTAFVTENPENAHGYYTLGRTHYLAFANKAFLVGATDMGSPPRIAPDWLLGDFAYHARRQRAMELTLQEFGCSSASDVPETERPKFWNSVSEKEEQLGKEGWEHEKPNDEQLAKHAASAVRNFRKAIELDPKNGLYHLGLASLLDQYVQWLREIRLDRVPEEFRSIILNRAKDIYYTAYDLSIRGDLKHKYLPLPGLGSLVGYEAGKAYIRLSEADESIPIAEQNKLSKIKKDLKKLEGLHPGAVTPIVFSLEKHSSLSDLLAPDLQVRFDLDGDGIIELWPWLKSTTGILVWDPEGRGVITSGRQLFGSVSWWLFFADGYHALDALDDNRDGMLSGQEFVGISVWFDRDCDGKSDAGEVLPLKTLQVASLATRSSGKDRHSPMNASGLTLTDGRVLPTYDWIASPVEPLP